MKAVTLSNNTAINDPAPGEMYALGQRRKVGISAGFGFISYGVGQFGGIKFNLGIFQKRVGGYNQYTGPPSRRARSYYVLQRTYRPTNPNTTAQQNQRSKFADAVASWQGLTTEQKTNYNIKAGRYGRFGYGYYLSEYLKSH